MRTLSSLLFDIIFSLFSIYTFVRLRSKMCQLDLKNPAKKDGIPEIERKVKEIEKLVHPSHFYANLMKMFELREIDNQMP